MGGPRPVAPHPGLHGIRAPGPCGRARRAARPRGGAGRPLRPLARGSGSLPPRRSRLGALARRRRRRPGPAGPALPRVLDAWRADPFVVDELELVASFLGEGAKGRPRHEVVATLPLGADPVAATRERPRGAAGGAGGHLGPGPRPGRDDAGRHGRRERRRRVVLRADPASSRHGDRHVARARGARAGSALPPPRPAARRVRDRRLRHVGLRDAAADVRGGARGAGRAAADGP